jgi:hypothetical protein
MRENLLQPFRIAFNNLQDVLLPLSARREEEGSAAGSSAPAPQSSDLLAKPPVGADSKAAGTAIEQRMGVDAGRHTKAGLATQQQAELATQTQTAGNPNERLSPAALEGDLAEDLTCAQTRVQKQTHSRCPGAEEEGLWCG